jgi:L-threonylcarbamoyladenylate synthase
MRLLAPTRDVLAEAARALARGKLVAFPTETVYGLGADALNPTALRRIFEAKGRPSDHPLIVHVASLQAAKQFAADWPISAQILAEAFWPGPLTLLVRRSVVVPDAVTGGQATVGLRWPRQATAQGLLEAFESVGSGAIAAPSANRFGGVSPSMAQHVMQALGDHLQPGDLILDDGPCGVGIESTIVDCTVDPVRILRPGGISRTAIDEVLSSLRGHQPRSGSTDGSGLVPVPRVSGSLASHYAPRTPLAVLAGQDLHQTLLNRLSQPGSATLLCWVRQLLPTHDPRVTQVLLPRSPEVLAQQLYARLHEWDAQGFDQLLVEALPEGAEWEAVRDRLGRAASVDGASHTP